MKRNVILILTVLFLAGCGQKETETKFEGVTSEKKDNMSQGMKYLQEGDVNNAIRSFDEAIKADPKNSKNYIVLGEVYLKLNNNDSAHDSFTAATKVDPNNADAFYYLAVCKQRKGEKDNALAAVKRSAELYMQSKDKVKFERSLLLLKELTGETMPAAKTK